MLNAIVSGSLNPADIRKSDPASLFKEGLILDAIDAQSRCRKYERQYDMYLSQGKYDQAERIHDLILFVDRPWEHDEAMAVPNTIRFTPEDLLEMYPKMFPNELKQE